MRTLEMFVAVSECGGVGAAARSLGIAQPTVSTAVQQLERKLGLQLLERSPRGSILTPAGLTIVDWARDVLRASARLEAGAAALRGRRDSQLRVSASMTIAEYLLPRWLSELSAREPALGLRLQVRNSESVAADVLSGAADLGYVEGVRLPDGLQECLMGVDELAVVVAPTHPWAVRREALHAAELAGAVLVLREAGSGTREAFERALRLSGFAVDPALVLGSTAAIKSAVAAGEAVGVLSALAVADEVAAGRLCRVSVQGLDLHRNLRMVWRAGTRLEGPAAVLATLSREAMARMRAIAARSTGRA